MNSIVFGILVLLVLIITVFDLFEVIVLNKYMSSARYIVLVALIIYATYIRSKNVK